MPLNPVAVLSTPCAAAGPAQAQRSPRKLLQYTGGMLAGSTPMQTYSPASYYAAPAAYSGSYAPNPAVGVLNNAMASGQAPSDIMSARGRGWVRGKIMGQRVDASGVATANMGHNQYGGITGLANAQGQFETSGRYGYVGGQGQASAAVATMREAGQANGWNVMHGAAAAQASGSIYGGLPSGQRFYGRGSASAQAEGTFMYATKK